MCSQSFQSWNELQRWHIPIPHLIIEKVESKRVRDLPKFTYVDEMQCSHKEGKSLLEEFWASWQAQWLELFGQTREIFEQADHFLISISSTLRVTPSLPLGKGVIAPKWHKVRQYLSFLTLSDSANSSERCLDSKVISGQNQLWFLVSRSYPWQQEEK